MYSRERCTHLNKKKNNGSHLSAHLTLLIGKQKQCEKFGEQVQTGHVVSSKPVTGHSRLTSAGTSLSEACLWAWAYLTRAYYLSQPSC